MSNRYPIWKYLLIVVIAILGFIYAVPNLYPPDDAIQISGSSGDMVIGAPILSKAEKALTEAGVEYFDPIQSERSAQLRFASGEAQLLGKKVVQQALGSEYVVALNQAPTTPSWLVSMGGEPMKLGLDLRGGVHFLLEVDVDSAIAKRQETSAEEMKDSMREARIRYSRVTLDEMTIVAEFRSEELRDQAISHLRSEYRQMLFNTDAPQTEGRFVFQASLSEMARREIEQYALTQNLTTLRKRVNELGVSEPIVQSQGRNRIIVQLPGVQDTAEAKRVIGKTANLEFRLEAERDALVSTTEAFEYRGYPAKIESKVILTGDHVANANASLDPETNMPQVNITLDSLGGNKMNHATRSNIGRRMGVLFIEYKTRMSTEVDEQGEQVQVTEQYVEKDLINLATIQGALGVQFRITGLDSPTVASELALMLRSGALAAPMYFVEERTIGPSLGAENIQLGVKSLQWGLGLVLLFMLVYYKAFGVFANLALAVNVLLLVSVMSLLGATLTLPGIAGIVLTVGMAVDANVLIFARIREEIKNGASPQAAISAGYDRAYVTILDANITTLIVAVILYAIGSGPVKGFAVTLSIGILTSMFTAIMGTRALTNLVYGGRKNLKKLWI
ncbi:protein translocase subunit SecD [Gilvimarinus agarilyticus]|uniref:protein translocase subunit SecD n=1 Tax=unclassified Gilvimarinus TaxID=2642066 RepID=UPI001C0A39BC|nr:MULTISPECIES: protein translocase subunit SecD [unclassified Gilvimarinus]MBU2887322.1 protein translocase subunit SecD [Gilvimarinus agarilyticus]MDO6571981.1 protein translocase subunit SecD [Gilvimarinus sp. 2_MG-2023]MDO6746049.1 protein translocase subunit SecD [Gilvimarinus sp. 1_MG-2023]